MRDAPCGCKPGTPENGWHETRSEACIARERAEFARAVERLSAELKRQRLERD